jgi:single-stranded-DNA-specific exonuclease
MTVRTSPMLWSVTSPPVDTDLASFGGVPPVVATLLHGRGISAREATTFLSDRTQSLADPSLLPGMADAVARLRYAYEHAEKVCVYGDYDADGLTAQAVLVTALRAWGFVDVCTYTPHREREGYGLHHEALSDLAGQGVHLVIAVDCGISNAGEVARIGERGVDVIVVDHHTVPVDIPAAAAVINPHLAESAYPFRDLAGVGVAYALVRALAASGAPFGRPEAEVLNTLLAFVAIGTVADVVPLRGENRTLVQAGLRAIRRTRHAGLRALCERAGVRQADLDAGHISFALAPRLNAPGRVRGVEDAYRLLMPETDVDARMAAVALDEANRTRQAETQRAVAEAVAMVESGSVNGADRLIFVGAPSWSIGIVGLVAAKLVERYHRPAFVYAQGVDESRGSARSIAAFNLIEALQAHADLMVHHGGHPRAAGFTVSTANIGALRDALHKQARMLTDDQFAPTLRLDAVLDHADITLSACMQVAALAPFGHGNAEPLFLIPRVRVQETRRVGADGAHLTFQALLDTGAGIRCIAFGAGPRERELANLGTVDLAAILQRDVWQGDERLQLRVRDFRPVE